MEIIIYSILGLVALVVGLIFINGIGIFVKSVIRSDSWFPTLVAMSYRAAGDQLLLMRELQQLKQGLFYLQIN